MNISNYSIPEIAAAMRLMRLTIYPTTLMLGLIGNTLVCILIIWSHKREKHSKAPRYFIFNLAISDLLVLILFIPFDMTYLESDHLMWNFGKFMCKLVNTVTYTSVVVSGTTMACISVERYRSIVHPMKEMCRARTIYFIILIIWIYAALTMAPFFGALEVFSDGRCSTNVRWWPNQSLFKITYILSGFVPGAVIPAMCISVSYTLIGVHLWREHKRNVQRGVLQHGLAAIRAKQNIKTTKLLATLVGTHAICILPHYVILLSFIFSDEHNAGPNAILFHEFTRLLMTANSCCNPLLYSLFSQNFRRGFKRMICGSRSEDGFRRHNSVHERS